LGYRLVLLQSLPNHQPFQSHLFECYLFLLLIAMIQLVDFVESELLSRVVLFLPPLKISQGETPIGYDHKLNLIEDLPNSIH
jgi:hypothetical protein